ncbi:MAG: hypothetical protein HY926_05345 [Elusimicrobia bacterium]|nr:hypothetical protein [Elusimicrobiota bacterium]
MARFFKKRRKNAGPNKNEEKVQRAADALSRESSGGVLGARYPFVKRLKITLQFFSPQQTLLDEKVMDIKANDPYRFDADCPGRCGNGHFDFSEAVANAVTRRRNLSESGGVCPQPIFAGASQTCGCQAKCRIEIDFLPLPAAPAGGPAAPAGGQAASA